MKIDPELLRGGSISIAFAFVLYLSHFFSDEPPSHTVALQPTTTLQTIPAVDLSTEPAVAGTKNRL